MSGAMKQSNGFFGALEIGANLDKSMRHLPNLFLDPFVHLLKSAGDQLHQEPLLLLQDLWLYLTERKEPNNFPKCTKMSNKPFYFNTKKLKTSS